jgi:glycyl-tRNA synthetase
MFIVKKKIGKVEYYYLRKSKRTGNKVKAITIAYLGKNKFDAEKKAKQIIINLQSNNKKMKSQENQNNPIKKSPSLQPSKDSSEKDFLAFIQESGLIWGPEPEIYGGLAGFYTYGPLGKLLKNKVENSVRKTFTLYNFKEIEGPTILPDTVWKASGHLETFSDRTIHCSSCKSIFRPDKLIEESHDVPADTFSDKKMLEFIKEHNIKCPNCKSALEKKINKQSLMMKTSVAGTPSSLRPETATVTYLPFPRFNQFFRKKLPFAVFQIGKAYRNEISPRQHVLRGREFTQAEGQIFLNPDEKNSWPQFQKIKSLSLPLWTHQQQSISSPSKSISLNNALKSNLIKSQAYAWCLWLAHQQFLNMGIPKEKIRIRQHHPDEKAFYADDAWDIELKLNNYGWTEVCGVHDRTDYDLIQHQKASGTLLQATTQEGKKYTPHVLEIAFGTDRPTYALIDIFYEKKQEEQGKTTFKIPYKIAPIQVAVFPLMKKPELTSLAKEIKVQLEDDFNIDYDQSGSIGRRYLRASQAGIPYCITIDFDSLKNKDVTLRDRDSEKQIRLPISSLSETIKKLLKEDLQFQKAGKLIK